MRYVTGGCGFLALALMMAAGALMSGMVSYDVAAAATMGIAGAITTATADVSGEILLIIPIALGIAVLPFVARLGWRFLRSMVK